MADNESAVMQSLLAHLRAWRKIGEGVVDLVALDDGTIPMTLVEGAKIQLVGADGEPITGIGGIGSLPLALAAGQVLGGIADPVQTRPDRTPLPYGWPQSMTLLAGQAVQLVAADPSRSLIAVQSRCPEEISVSAADGANMPTVGVGHCFIPPSVGDRTVTLVIDAGNGDAMKAWRIFSPVETTVQVYTSN